VALDHGWGNLKSLGLIGYGITVPRILLGFYLLWQNKEQSKEASLS